MLECWRAGQSEALHQLFQLIYGELRVDAKHFLKKGLGHASFSGTELANEVFLRLANYPVHDEKATFVNRKQFFGLTQKAMLHIFLDYQRGKKAQKRSGKQVPLSPELIGEDCSNGPQPDLAQLEAMLGELALQKPAWYRIIHQRFLEEKPQTVSALAKQQGVSEREIYRKTKLALAWLKQRISIGTAS